MSRERLEWTLALLDRASGPARRVARGLDAVTVAQERVTRASKGAGAARDPLGGIERGLRRRRGAREARVGRQLDEYARSQQEATAGATRFRAAGFGAMAVVGAAAIGAAVAVGRLTVALGQSMVEAADWRNRTEGAFRVLLNSPTLAGQAFQRASQYANRFGLDVREVARQMTQLTAAGFSQSEIPRVMQLAGDLGALEGPQAAERAITAIRQIRAKGVLQMEELSGQLADAGLSVGDVVAEIGRRRGLRGNEAAVGNQVRALITGRRINANEGIDAIMGVVARRGGGTLGATLDTQSRGAEAAMNRLRNSWLLLQSNFARSAAFQRIIGFIERMATALDPSSASAQRFGAQIDRLFDVLTSGASRVDPVALFNSLVGAIDTVSGAFRRVYPYVEAFYGSLYGRVGRAVGVVVPMLARFFGALFTGGGPSIETVRTLGNVFGMLASFVIGAVGAVLALGGVLVRVFTGGMSVVREFWGSIVGAFSGVELTFAGIGGAIIRGLINGVRNGAVAAVEAVRGLATSVVGGVRSALGIRSPSRVFAELGGHVASGFAMGIEGGAAGVRSSIGSMVDVGAVGARAAGAARGGAPLALTINVTAPEGADADEWGAVIASHVAREIGGRTERAA